MFSRSQCTKLTYRKKESDNAVAPVFQVQTVTSLCQTEVTVAILMCMCALLKFGDGIQFGINLFTHLPYRDFIPLISSWCNVGHPVFAVGQMT